MHPKNLRHAPQPGITTAARLFPTIPEYLQRGENCDLQADLSRLVGSAFVKNHNAEFVATAFEPPDSTLRAEAEDSPFRQV